MSWVNECEFEPVVREAMQARPQPRSISNLAFRAMELARERARVLARRQLEGFLRLRRRTRWMGMIAAVLVAVVVWVGATKLVNTRATTGYTTNTSSEQGATDSASTGNGPTVSAGSVVTAELLVVAMILLSGGISWQGSETLCDISPK